MQKEKQKFYQAKWFLWLCLILFPPVGIILIWSIHKEMKSKTKIILSIVFALWFAILMISTQGAKDGFEDGMKETPPTKQEEQEQSLERLPTFVDGACRAMTKKFVEEVLEEDYSMTAYSVEEFELDKDENGTIKILYLPSNAGDGATKVNLTITKNDSVHKIEYALLSGIDEVELDKLSKDYTELIYQ